MWVCTCIYTLPPPTPELELHTGGCEHRVIWGNQTHIFSRTVHVPHCWAISLDPTFWYFQNKSQWYILGQEESNYRNVNSASVDWWLMYAQCTLITIIPAVWCVWVPPCTQVVVCVRRSEASGHQAWIFGRGSKCFYPQSSLTIHLEFLDTLKWVRFTNVIKNLKLVSKCYFPANVVLIQFT